MLSPTPTPDLPTPGSVQPESVLLVGGYAVFLLALSSEAGGLWPEDQRPRRTIRNHAPSESVGSRTTLAATGAVTRHVRMAFRAGPVNFFMATVSLISYIPSSGYRKGMETER